MYGLVVKRLLSRASIVKMEKLLEQPQSMSYLIKQQNSYILDLYEAQRK